MESLLPRARRNRSVADHAVGTTAAFERSDGDPSIAH
jgi:hypothetical protein